MLHNVEYCTAYTGGIQNVGHIKAYAVFSLKVSYLKTYEISLHVVFSAAHYGHKFIVQHVFINSKGELTSVERIHVYTFHRTKL